MRDTAWIAGEPHLALLIRRSRRSTTRGEKVDLFFGEMRRFIAENVHELLPLIGQDIARRLAGPKRDRRLVWKRKRAFRHVVHWPQLRKFPKQWRDVIRSQLVQRPPEDQAARAGILHPPQQHHGAAAFRLPAAPRAADTDTGRRTRLHEIVKLTLPRLKLHF